MLIIIAFCCLMASAFVSGSEIAYFGLTHQEIEELEDSTQPRDRKALSFIKDSERLLATILISNNLVNITMVVLLTFAISQTVVFNSSLLNFLLQTVFMTFLLLLFGEIFPKLVARGSAGHRSALYRARSAGEGHGAVNKHCGEDRHQKAAEHIYR